MYYDQYTYSAILKSMKDGANDSVDKSEGNYLHDSLAPTAVEFENIYVEMDKILMFFFMQDMYGEDLDKKGAEYGVPRKMATNAIGKVVIKGNPGQMITPANSINRIYKNLLLQFALLDENGEPSSIVIGDTGEIEADVKCLSAGEIGNVPPGDFDIDILGVSISNIYSLAGGVDDESDRLYLQRIFNKIKNTPSSGNKKDYERWATNVPGIGYAKCIPLAFGNGTVKIIVASAEGMPVDNVILKNAQDYIDPFPGMGEGEAPVGARVTIVSAGSFFIDVNIKGLVIESGFGIAGVRSNIESVLAEYMKLLPIGSIIKRQFVGAAIVNVKGIQDFDNILLNGLQDNLTLTHEQKPILGQVIYSD